MNRKITGLLVGLLLAVLLVVGILPMAVYAHSSAQLAALRGHSPARSGKEDSTKVAEGSGD